MFRSRSRCHPIFIEEEPPWSPPRRRLRLRYLLVLAVAVAAGWGWRAVQAQPGAEQVGAGELLLTDGETGAQHPAVGLDSSLQISVSGMVAAVVLEQRFRNDSENWVEGRYQFPLPDRAAVSHMRVIIGERVIEGKVREKAQAQQLYQQAKSEGRRAGLVDQQRPNLFTTRVANIGPYETVTVQLEYVESVAYEAGRFSLRFPMTITPRYIPGVPVAGAEQTTETLEEIEAIKAMEPGNTAIEFDAATDGFGWARNTDQVPDAAAITPWLNPRVPSPAQLINPIAITAAIDMGMPLQAVDSAYHRIVTQRENDIYRIRLTAGRVSMDRDFVLSWQPGIADQPRAAVFSETVDGDDYGLLMVVPPLQAPQSLAREVIYVIDTSGSMDGVSMQQARRGLVYALAQLAPQDRFNIIAFNSTTRSLFTGAVPASAANLATANAYVGRLQSGGGTEMLPALQAALAAADADTAAESGVRQVIFITDGAVGNEQALFSTIYAQLGSSRLFTVGIGSAPNTHFMRKAAQFGRGTFTHIGDVAEVEEKMQVLMTKLNTPLVTRMAITWPDHHPLEQYPARLPDLYRGEPLLVAVKLRDLRGDIVVSGRLADRDWQQRIHVDAAGQHSGVAKLWAREKIAELLDRRRGGADAEDLREAVLAVALTHQLLSPYTSFVALEEAPARPSHAPLRESNVLNARPQGQGAQVFAYPKTATAAMPSLCWGLSLVALCLLLAWALRREETHATDIR